MQIEHGRLVNDFASWGSWDGAERLGMDTPAESNSAEDTIHKLST